MSKQIRDKYVEIGAIGRPHGVNGKVRVFLHYRDSNLLDHIHHLYFKEKDLFCVIDIVNAQPSRQSWIVELKGIISRSEAEQLTGKKIFVERQELPKLEPGEFYVFELIGLEAWDGLEMVGSIRDSRSQGEVEVVTVVNQKEEFEIPLVADYVELLDMEQGRVVFREIAELRNAFRPQKDNKKTKDD